MRALTVIPHSSHSARLEDVANLKADATSVLVETLAVGICGTDFELVSGTYGWPPPGRTRLVIGHESLGRIIEPPPACGWRAGEVVVGIVRRPDPEPCANCAIGEWDMCRNGRYTEHGIKEIDGFCRERFLIPADALVRVDPALDRVGVLLEPASVVAKAWEHIEVIGRRARWGPRRVLVTGAGPIGLLAALMGRQRGLAVDVLDRVTTGPKPGLVRDLDAEYHADGDVTDLARRADVVVECTGVGALVFKILEGTPPGAIICLTGISTGGRLLEMDFASLNKRMVLENDVVFGSVNANRRHYEAAAESLAKADRAWLERLITRRVGLDRWGEAFDRRPDDVKTIIDFTL